MLTKTCEELYQAQSTGSTEYNNVRLNVKGVVTYVGPDMYGLPSIEISMQPDGKQPQALIVMDGRGVKVGNTITVEGNDTGFGHGMVIFKHCVLKVVK